jgi:hypothetical protein
MIDLKRGDMVEARAGTLARFGGDHYGVVARIDGDSIIVEMDNSGRMVPFRRDQLDAVLPARQSNSRLSGR